MRYVIYIYIYVIRRLKVKRTDERFRNLYRRLACTRFSVEVEIHTYTQKYTLRLCLVTNSCDFQSPKPHDWAFQSRHLATMLTACQVASSDSCASRVNYWYTTKSSFLACFLGNIAFTDHRHDTETANTQIRAAVAYAAFTQLS